MRQTIAPAAAPRRRGARDRARWILLVLCASVGFSAIAGCAPVKAWQRGTLMLRVMRDPINQAEASFDSHVFRTREATLGGGAGGGASCGCN